MDIQIALAVDGVLLVASLWCMLQISDRSIFNPSLWWMALHAYTVTFRLIALNLGSESEPTIGIRSSMELVNAAIASDISLLAVVAATIVAFQWSSNDSSGGQRGSKRFQLSPRLGQIISILCIVIGTYALLKFGGAAHYARTIGRNISAVDIGRFEETSYPIIIAGFAVQGALLQCAVCGFTRWRVVLLLVLLALTYINLARTNFILAIILALLIYMTARYRRTVSLGWIFCALLLSLVWFTSKPLIGAIVTGESVGEIMAGAEEYLNGSAKAGSSIDTQFLDMQASFMAAADESGQRFYGSTILPMLYLPIPRFVWPDKPRTNEFAVGLSSSSRRMVQSGYTPTLSGESYLNFGWIGCAVIPFLYLLFMQRAYGKVSGLGITSAARWVYLVFLVCMVQVFRDGLNSLIRFAIVDYLPILSWGILSILLHTAHSPIVNQRLRSSVRLAGWRPS